MVYNFSAGPAILPQDVLTKVQAELLDFKGIGFSIMEASHRSPAFQDVIDTAEAQLRQLMGIPDDYAVLFLQGGASSQFFTIPMNFMGDGQSADYADTGAWSAKAYKEAANLGSAKLACSSKGTTYNQIPDFNTWDCDPSAAYLHVTSNNTIYGTQFQSFPQPLAGVPMIADMSSDILSRPLNVKDFGMIYAGAQKNIGPSGVTLVIMRKELAERSPASLPTMLNYNTHIDKGSMFNTPPTFGIYFIKLVTDWLLENGGLSGMQKKNEAKAKLIYDQIDADGFYSGTARLQDRSMMNLTFNCQTEEQEKTFLAEAKDVGLVTLKGHRSIGGIRASIYNAMPEAGCQALADFMADFRRKNG